MYIPPSYTLTTSIAQKLAEIAKLKTQLELFPQDKIQEKYSRAKTLLKSSLFSARIEGNSQTMTNLSATNWQTSREQQKLEVANLYRALEFILKKSWRSALTVDHLCTIHQLVLKRLSDEAGYIRSEPSAIYNQAGIAVNICPLPVELRALLNQLLNYINHNYEAIIPIKAALAHFMLENIHPFLDGNGRVGRLFIHLICKKDHYDLRGLAPLEEYIDQHKSEYYDLLSNTGRDKTAFVEFFLTALIAGLKSGLKEKQWQAQHANQDSQLPPRRLEILHIINDHRTVTFNFIKRRFLNIPDRTLRYDLAALVKAKKIKKFGRTRNTLYQAV